LLVVRFSFGCGPGDSNLDHTPEEHIDLDEYQKAIAVLEKTFLNL